MGLLTCSRRCGRSQRGTAWWVENQTTLNLGTDVNGCRRTACALAAAPASTASISRESDFQKPPDLERHGRGGRLHALVGWRGRVVSVLVDAFTPYRYWSAG